jgi:NAD(P)-dependent dehydrogenase (short-subunit alcohol dehydrogenase family)
VYACAPDAPRSRAGVEEALARIAQHAGKSQEAGTGTVYFHELDLASVRKARASARALKERVKSAREGERLDILVANAAVASSSSELSPDGYDNNFAVNCLGHFVFVNSLLGPWKPFFPFRIRFWRLTFAREQS